MYPVSKLFSLKTFLTCTSTLLDWQTSHSLTVVFFCRTFITPNKSSGQALNLQERDSETIRKDVDGRLYEVRCICFVLS